MTIIVGIVDKDKSIHMGGDSQTTSEYAIHLRKEPKVFFNGEFLIGYSGSVRFGQVLRFSFKPPEHPEGISTYKYMCTLFMDTLRQCLRDGGCLRIVDEIEESEESNFLVGYRGHLFYVDSDFQVGEYHDDYAACGHAREYALGSLFTTGRMTDVTNRVKIALEAANRFSACVGGPFVIEKLQKN